MASSSSGALSGIFFVPRKKDAKGRVFGLVQMVLGIQAETTIFKANGLLPDGRHLQVNPAHFGNVAWLLAPSYYTK